MMVLLLITCFFTLLLSAFCSASETSFFSLSNFERNKILHDRKHSKALRFCLHHLPEILTLILLANLMINVAFSLQMQRLFDSLFGKHPAILPLCAVSTTLILVLLGEVIPKNFALLKRLFLVKHIAHVWYGFVWVSFPVLKRFSALVERLSQVWIGIFFPKQDFNKIKEMKHLLALTRRKGSFSGFERALIQNIAELHTVNAKDLMTPRVDVKMVNLKWSRTEVTTFLQKNKHTFFPVFKGAVDQIAGILDARLFLLEEGEIPLHVQHVAYVPETIRFLPLLAFMKEKRAEVVLVVDEYGGFAGLIRYLDVLEQLTRRGEQARRRHSAHYLGKGHYQVRGDMSLTDLQTLLRVDFKQYHSDTLNGLVQEMTGNIPKEEITLHIAPIHIKILKVSRTSLLKAEIWRDKHR
jgi:CBS domain containing-hemolysin-like protein